MNSLGLAYWYEQSLGSDGFPEAAVATMMQQPGFEDACAACASGALALRATNSALARAFRDSSRTFYAMFVLILDARGPVTLASLQALAAELGVASRGRAAAMMMYLRMIGYLERSAEQTNRRSIGFVAAPKLLTIHDLFTHNELSAAARLEPEARPILERLHEPAIRRAYLRQMGVGLTRLLRMPSQPTTLFAERDGGLAILYQLALSGDGYPARGPVQLSLSDTARRHGVSRSHVTRLLRDAAQSGLLWQESNGRWTIEEPLRQALYRLHALSFVGHAAFAYHALRTAGDGGISDGGRARGEATGIPSKAASAPNGNGMPDQAPRDIA